MSTSFSVLPCIWTLPISRRTLLVSRLCSDQHAGAFQLISNAAERGDNIGCDEFPSLDKFTMLMLHSEALVMKNIEDNQIEYLILVSDCKPVRSVHPTLASVHIITSKSLQQKMFWRELAQVAEMFIHTGLQHSVYSAVVTYVFVSCVDRMLVMREQGFIITACVPLAGVLQGFPGGHCGSYIMYKHLGREPVAFPFVLDINSSVLPTTSVVQSSLPTLDYLPFEHVLHDGVVLHVRALLPSDVSILYKAFTDEIHLGTGYGLDELPTLEFFRYRYVNEWCTLVFELSSENVLIKSMTEDRRSLPPAGQLSNEVTFSSTSALQIEPSQISNESVLTAHSREIVAYGNFGPSSYARSAHPVIADVNVIVLPKWRGRKWSLDVMKVCLQGIASSGYLGVQGEASVDNLGSIKMMLGTGYVINGTLPLGIFYKDKGWVDSNMSYIPLSVIQQNI